ncbi:AMP-dependent synthetase [Methylobacterium indicum]|nr:AMP-dependent synthetase [Methylobacterium indicum]
MPARYNIGTDVCDRHAPGNPLALIHLDHDGAVRRYGFDDLRRWSNRFANVLTAHGLVRGDRIGVLLPQAPETAVAHVTGFRAGLISIPLFVLFGPDALRYRLGNSGAKAVVTDRAGAALIAGIRDALPGLERVYCIDGAGEGAEDFQVLCACASDAFTPVDTAADDPAVMVYTSGTTSRPKGVLHAHRTIWGRRPMHDFWLGLREDDVVLHAGTMNWTYTLGVGIQDPWARGATTVLYNGKRDPALWPALIARHRATLFAAVPSLYRQILKYADLSAHDLSSLRHGITAGEALSPRLLAEWQAATGTPLYEALGMSEISTYVSTSPRTPIKPGSPGKPQPGRRVAILPPEGAPEPLPPGEIGLLAIHRSDPALMLGYWNRPEEEAAVMRGEWFAGGDLASLDAEGYVWFEGRNDDIMNAFGYRVSPNEVESVLIAHPDVQEVAVTELPVRDGVRVIAAFVVPKQGAEPARDALLAWCGERLAAYKCPREVVFLETLPRTPNGKVQRKRLAAA